MKTQLRRQGVSETVNGYTKGGIHVEIGYHHGGKYYFCDATHRAEGTDLRMPTYSTKHMKLKAESMDDAIKESGEKLKIEIDPEIEAYCYSNAKTRELWPRVVDDVYITSATYNAYSDTIRHEPTNVGLIWFGEDGKSEGQQFRDGYNEKWTKQIKNALKSYNSNVEAHGEGVERKEWLAWLVGQYIRELPGEKPMRTQKIDPNDNPTHNDFCTPCQEVAK